MTQFPKVNATAVHRFTLSTACLKPTPHPWLMSPYHVAESDGGVLGVVLHQGVVVGGEERTAADSLGQLLHHSTGNRRAVVRSCAPTCTGGTNHRVKG